MTAQQKSAVSFNPLRLSTGTVHPFHIYGTGFKEGRTGELTTLALKKGFRGLDSANYPSAYEEASVGDAIESALKSGIKREDLFIQTKFTPIWAHDESKLPYNADQPLEDQVRESVQQSLQNLKVDYIDALLLHVPFKDEQDNMVAWRVMESFVPSRVGVLGVSNFGLAALEKLYAAATIKPEIVQNRFQEESNYFACMREYLDQKGILYQAFNLLKANEQIRSSELVARVAERFHTQREVAFYMLVLGLGNMSIVNGTTSEEHMEMDLTKIAGLLGDQQAVSELTEYLGEFEQLLRTE